jgi:polar amino acid transport system substrate-binding protein
MRFLGRILSFALLMSLTAILIMGCGNKQATQPDNDTDKVSSNSSTSTESLFLEIKKRGKVTVGTEAAFEPFEFVQDGEIVGYGSDILAYIVKDLGVELEQMDLPWQGILPGLDAERFDFVATAVSITPERAEKYAFTVPIADGTVAILKRKGDDSIKSPEDIIGKIVGSQLSSGQMQSLNNYNDELKSTKGEGVKEIKEYVSYPEAYQDLATGRIDAVANSMANLSTVIKKQPDTFEIVDTFGEPMWFSWVVRKGDDELLDYLNERILELRDSGKLGEMQKKWFGFTMETPDSGFLPKK